MRIAVLTFTSTAKVELSFNQSEKMTPAQIVALVSGIKYTGTRIVTETHIESALSAARLMLTAENQLHAHGTNVGAGSFNNQRVYSFLFTDGRQGSDMDDSKAPSETNALRDSVLHELEHATWRSATATRWVLEIGAVDTNMTNVLASSEQHALSLQSVFGQPQFFLDKAFGDHEQQATPLCCGADCATTAAPITISANTTAEQTSWLTTAAATAVPTTMLATTTAPPTSLLCNGSVDPEVCQIVQDEGTKGCVDSLGVPGKEFGSVIVPIREHCPVWCNNCITTSTPAPTTSMRPMSTAAVTAAVTAAATAVPTTTTAPPTSLVCNGSVDPAVCQIVQDDGTKGCVDSLKFGSVMMPIREHCPVWCNSCVTTSTPAPTTSTTCTDDKGCQFYAPNLCGTQIGGVGVLTICPQLCGVCEPTTTTTAAISAITATKTASFATHTAPPVSASTMQPPTDTNPVTQPTTTALTLETAVATCDQVVESENCVSMAALCKDRTARVTFRADVQPQLVRDACPLTCKSCNNSTSANVPTIETGGTHSGVTMVPGANSVGAGTTATAAHKSTSTDDAATDAASATSTEAQARANAGVDAHGKNPSSTSSTGTGGPAPAPVGTIIAVAAGAAAGLLLLCMCLCLCRKRKQRRRGMAMEESEHGKAQRRSNIVRQENPLYKPGDVVSLHGQRNGVNSQDSDGDYEQPDDNEYSDCHVALAAASDAFAMGSVTRRQKATGADLTVREPGALQIIRGSVYDDDNNHNPMAMLGKNASTRSMASHTYEPTGDLRPEPTDRTENRPHLVGHDYASVPTIHGNERHVDQSCVDINSETRNVHARAGASPLYQQTPAIAASGVSADREVRNGTHAKPLYESEVGAAPCCCLRLEYLLHVQLLRRLRSPQGSFSHQCVLDLTRVPGLFLFLFRSIHPPHPPTDKCLHGARRHHC